jgi:hypothetical protein
MVWVTSWWPSQCCTVLMSRPERSAQVANVIPEFVNPHSLWIKTRKLCDFLRGPQEVSLHFAA